jgi:hypothetical protein
MQGAEKHIMQRLGCMAARIHLSVAGHLSAFCSA